MKDQNVKIGRKIQDNSHTKEISKWMTFKINAKKMG